MFGDIFATEEEILSGQAGGQVQNAWERLPRNCADKLPMPDLPRKKGYPIGLKNQGATCYLNSLFQLLFRTPELRDIILQLPLCKENSQTPSGFVSQNKHNFLLGFQRLFSEMLLCDQRAVGTQYLQKAFGWENQQHMEQQDIQEAMRVIFDTIERALFGTEYYESIKSLFRGATTRYKTCTVCTQASERPQQFYDLSLQVKFISNVQEALQALTTPESMNGDNAIFCETCQCKQDMLLGTRLQQLPGTLVLTLNRFDFDFEKMDRVKLNSYFEFQLEMDLSPFLMPTVPDHNKYQLYGVVIHRGSAHGGHYLCFSRDLMHETQWEKGLQQTKAQQARIKEGSEGKEKKKKDKDEIDQDKEFQLKQPTNKKLLQGWYQINDNVTTAIDAKKITSKFEGSDSAYILFYRRKSLPVSQKQPKVPAYFADPIVASNKAMEKEREVYEYEKQHIVLKIEGEDHKLKNSMTLNDFKSTFIPLGSALVLESTHNGLPFYPLQICNHPDVEYKAEQSLISFEVPHQSIWKRYVMNSPEYEEIRGAIGKERLPMQLVILVDGQSPKKIIAYGDENFIMLRLKIQKILNVAYEKQIITLVTAYKQQVLTDNSQNDDMILPKLGIIHGAQLQIKSQANEQDEGVKEENKKEDSLMICFVIQRDDVIGLKRFYFQKAKTLDELLQYFLSMESLDDDKKRRFRNLNGNRLFYTDHYTKTLEELQFSEEMVRLRLERGEVPIKGDILIKIKMQSTLYKKEGEEQVSNIEKIFDPNTLIKDVKEWACEHYKLDLPQHKLYLTDWMGEPVRSLTREHLTIFEGNFGREQTICLRDIYSPIGAQLVHIEVFTTLTGAPDSTEKDGVHVKIEEFKTVRDLKTLLINTFELKDITPERLRLREIKRDYMFGSVWRDESKSVKSVTINSNKIVYQVLQQPEQLSDDQIVLTLKLRNKEKRLYEGSTELVFNAGKTPSVEELTEAVKARVGVQEDLIIIKYFHYNFQWIELSRKQIEELAKEKKKTQQKKKGAEQKGKKKEDTKTEGDKNKTEDKKIESKPEGGETKKEEKKKEKEPKKKQTESNLRDGEEEAKIEDKKQTLEKKGQQKQQKGKKEKKGGKGEQHHKDLLEQCQNLRKAPILLKDGDLLGWGPASQLEGDDFQTDEDLAWRVQLKKETAKYKGKEKGGFKLGVDF